MTKNGKRRLEARRRAEQKRILTSIYRQQELKPSQYMHPKGRTYAVTIVDDIEVVDAGWAERLRIQKGIPKWTEELRFDGVDDKLERNR